jgi:prevent-host-death family protein
MNIHEAKNHFTKLVDSVAHGHEIIITKAGKPIAKVSPSKPGRRFGVLKGKIKLAKDFDAPLPDETFTDFEA